MAHYTNTNRGASGIPCTGSYKLPNPVTKVNIASSQHSQHSLSASPQPLGQPTASRPAHSQTTESTITRRLRRTTTVVKAHLPTMVAQAHRIFNIQNGER